MSAAISCHHCELRVGVGGAHANALARGASLHCPRCLGVIRHRKPQSLDRTIALILAAIILYIPANIYPIMTLTILGDTSTDTILEGVENLYTSGMWEIATLVFFASITVPLLKIVGLIVLVFSVRARVRWSPHDRTRLYRVIDYIGRWSMIDMFMLSILVALVQLGAVANVEPGIGATCFAAVVILTIFAASSFDPRLIWDKTEEAQ